MHPREALVEALKAQVRVGQDILGRQLSLPSPCAGWSVRQVMNHSIGVTLKFAFFASGVTDHPRAPPGDLVGADHRLALRSTRDAAQEAWASADMTRTCHLSFGSFPADLAAGINVFDVLAHTWDVATATAVRLDCAEEVWEAGLDAARVVVGADRDLDHYAPEIPIATAARPQERLLGFLGRSDSPNP